MLPLHVSHDSGDSTNAIMSDANSESKSHVNNDIFPALYDVIAIIVSEAAKSIIRMRSGVQYKHGMQGVSIQHVPSD